MICAIVHQLTRDLTPEQLKESGFDQYYVDHTLALWPQAASGTPWSATTFQSKGDPITDLHEDLAAEQKARTTYDNILRLVKDPEVCDPIRFLREREIVHYQRFGESLRIIQDHLDSKNFYAINPEVDLKSLFLIQLAKNVQRYLPKVYAVSCKIIMRVWIIHTLSFYNKILISVSAKNSGKAPKENFQLLHLTLITYTQ